MSGWTKTQRYECHSGCTRGGCPGHDATLTYHGAADIYEWDDGHNARHVFDLNELRTFLDIVTPYFEEPLKGEDSMKPQAYKLIKDGHVWDCSNLIVDMEDWTRKILREEPDAVIEVQTCTWEQMLAWKEGLR